MKKHILWLLLSLLTFGARAQLSVQETFEGLPTDWGYTSNTANYPAPAASAATEYFLRVNQTPNAAYVPYSNATAILGNQQGNYFWATEAVSGIGSRTRAAGYVQLNNITTTGYKDLQVKIALSSPRGNGNTGTFGRLGVKRGDKLEVQYSFDGTNYTTVGRVTGDDGSGSDSGRWKRDANLSGDASDDAAEPILNMNFTDYTFNITATGATLRVRIVVDDISSSAGELVFDNIRVTGAVDNTAKPVLTEPTTTPVAYTEGGPAVQITSTLDVAYPSGSGTLTGATVQIQSGFVATEDRLIFINQNGISGSYNTGTGVLTMVSSALPLATYQTALRSIQYQNTNTTTATGGNRVISFTVNNGATSSNTVLRTVAVTAVLNAPAALPYTENLDTDGEGTRYTAGTFVNSVTQAGFFRATAATPVGPGNVAVTNSAFSGYSGSGYWYGEGAKTPGNPTNPLSTFQLAPVDASGKVSLKFIISLGMGQGSQSIPFDAADFLKLYYRAGSTNNWVLFGAFYGINTTSELRQDLNLDGVAETTSPRLTAAMQDITFTNIPNSAAVSSLDFKVEVSSDASQEATFDNIRISAAVAPTLTTTAATSITSSSAALGGNVTSDGGDAVTGRGVVYSSSNTTPTVGGSGTTTVPNGTGTGTYSATISGLTPGTTYYVQAYATNGAGTSYGGVQTFATAAVAPTVTTATPSGIMATSAVLGGNVTASGGAAVTGRGVVYSSSNATPTVGGANTTQAANGSGTGTFSATISSLAPGTRYYVQAYALNSVGTSYGGVQQFVTPPNAPVLMAPANNGLIATTTPTYSGTAQANSSITVYVDGSSRGTTTADGLGNWSLTQPTALSQGSHTVYATAQVSGSAASANSTTNTFIIDTVPPSAPVVMAPINNRQVATTTPTYSGTAEANSTVTVYVDGSSRGTTTADGLGNWSLTQPTALSQGGHTVYATARDAAGNTSANSFTTNFTVDTVPPSVTSLTSSNGASGSTTTTSPLSFSVSFSESVGGFTSSGIIVTNGTVTSAPAGSGSGPYTFQVTPTTAGTATTVTISSGAVQDAAGNSNGSASSTYSLTYSPTVTVTAVTGLTPSPTATAQVTYRVTFSGSVSGLTTTNFSLTPGTSVSGASVASVSGGGTTYTVVVNTGTGDGTLQLNVTNSTGVTPTITNVPYTSGTQYTITKSFAAAPTLRLQGVGSASGGLGDVTAFVDVVQVLSGGSPVANALQNTNFESNNVSASGFLYSYQGVVASPWVFGGTYSGISRNGSGFGSTAFTGDAVLLLQSANSANGFATQSLAVPTGSYQIGFQTSQRTNQSSDQVVQAFVNNVFVGSIQPSNASYQLFTSTTFKVTAPDLMATVSTTSGSPTSTTPIPFSVSFSQTVGTTFTASDVTVTGGTLNAASFSGNGTGPYTFTVTPSGAGTVTVSLAAGVANDANNTGNSASNSVSVQYQLPVTAAPVVTTPANGSTSTTSTPTYSGTASVGSTVTVYVDGSSIGTTTATGGSFSLTQPTALTQGSHTVYATAQLSGQAVSANSNTNSFTVSTTATYTSSTADQPTLEQVTAGSTNQVILRVAVVIGGGSISPLSATAFSFTTNGSTSAADITAARVYYTGTSTTFGTGTAFGSAVAAPNGAFTVTGTQQLTTGTNYFWLVYDVAAAATAGNVLDATITSLTVGGTARTPSVTAPAGSRPIIRISRVAGQALRFAGGNTAGYVNFSASPVAAPLLGPEYTQVAWIKPSIGTGSVTYYVLGNGTGNTAAPYIAITGNGRVEAGFGTGSTVRSVQTGPQTINTGVWNQVAATFNGSLLSLYLNGNSIATLTTPDLPGTTRVSYVGSAGTTGSNFFPGDVEEVSQWSRALSTAELRRLRHLTLSGTETGLVSYLQFNDAGSTTTDGISGAVGTLTGATRVTSTAPVGGGVSSLQSVTGTGSYSFAGTSAAINYTAVSGTPYDVVVARLEGTPLGTPVSDANLRSTHTRAYWIVDSYNPTNSSFTANVTYTLDPGLISAGDAAAPSNLKLYKRGSNSDAAFDAPISATAANAVASTVTFPVNSFSQTFIGTYGTSPLPVELVRFTAERKGTDALLQWATAQEQNNAYFEVESSVDGRTFRAVGRVSGHGSSAQPHDYQLTDANLARYGRAVVYYRLRQVDVDGTSTLSSVQMVQVPGVASSLTARVFPNPAAGQLTVRLSSPYTGKAQGWLFDAQGRMVQELSRQLAAAPGPDISLSVAHLPNGVYTLRLILDGQVLHQQIVVQH